MLFTENVISTEELNSINNFFKEIDNEFEAVKTVEATEIQKESTVTKYLHSLVCNHYEKAINDIENTKVGNKVVRKRNLQQVMRESFFYGANRFGNNFIA